MTKMKQEHVTKLKKAPLQEVIFEVLWELSKTSEGVETDEGFDLALGKFAELVKKSFPITRRLFPPGIPIDFLKRPLFQFLKKENSLPLLQLGKGIFALNDSDLNYIWEDSFRPMIEDSVNCLFGSYENSLVVNQLNLRYIDAFEIIENSVENIPVFVNDNLQTTVQNRFNVPGKFNGINMTQQFLLEDNTEISINISSAFREDTGKNAVLCQFIASKRNSFSKEDVFAWVDIAHEHLSNLFTEMLNKDFYESLK